MARVADAHRDAMIVYFRALFRDDVAILVPKNEARGFDARWPRLPEKSGLAWTASDHELEAPIGKYSKLIGASERTVLEHLRDVTRGFESIARDLGDLTARTYAELVATPPDGKSHGRR